jgi:hypothetical protein
MAAVKNGAEEPWEPRPYAVWSLDDMDINGCAAIRSAAYDPPTNRLYITQAFGEEPRVDVYRIGPEPTTATLYITFSGTGGGRVTSLPEGIDCSVTPCSAAFPFDSEVTLHGLPNDDSILEGWSACSGKDDCFVTIYGEKSVAASFAYVLPVRIPGDPVSYSTKLGEAVAALSVSGAIEARRVSFEEDVVINNPVAVVLKGGYDTAYNAIIGTATLKGSLTVQKGSRTVQGLKIM